MTKNERKKEFIESRTSWEYFESRLDRHPTSNTEAIILLEILKEFQYLNDRI